MFLSLLKLGFNQVSKDTAFWVRVLRSKYGMKVRVPESIASGMCSAVWIGLAKYNSTYKSHLSRHLVIGSEHPLKILKLLSVDEINGMERKGYKNVLIHMDSIEFVKALQCIPRERNKVADRFAKVASDRNTEVKVFVNFPEEMLDEFRFCLKALSTPEVIAAIDTTQLGTLIMKLGVANAKATLNLYNEIIKKPGSPQALKALNMCVEAYKYAILSFEMVSSELVEDP
ncbi:hypothetical protein Gotri_010706, partial [Gossypium trilobum]|nr:hypothetical protein [Gossypium trilobum]